MTTCPACAAPVASGSRFCTGCGSPLEAPTAVIQRADDAESTMPRQSVAPAPPQVTSAVPAATQAAPSVTSAASVVPPSPASTLPALALLPGETILHDESFSPSMILPHLKSRIVLTNVRVIGHRPNTLFGVIPFGYFASSAPLSAIEQVDSGVRTRTRRLVWGAVLVLLGFLEIVGAGLLSSMLDLFDSGRGVAIFFGLILLAIGVVLILSAKIVGVFATTGSESVWAAGRGHEQARLETTAQVITEAVISHEDPRSLGFGVGSR